MVYEYANRSDVISMIGSYRTPFYVVRRVDAQTNEVMYGTKPTSRSQGLPKLNLLQPQNI